MQFDEFERKASAVWEEIPETYREGVDGLVIQRDPQAHPDLDEIYTLGECVTESYPSDWGGPDTTRSILVLYYGSFRELARLDPEFDWDFEIWETVTHELRHHLEWLAAEDALEDVDYAMDENFKRLRGDPFDPWFFRSGEPAGPDLYQAERDLFLERHVGSDPAPDATVEFEWEGATYRLPAPEESADLTFVQVTGGLELEDAELCVVLVRRRGRLRSLMDWLRRRPLTVREVDAAAEPVL